MDNGYAFKSIRKGFVGIAGNCNRCKIHCMINHHNVVVHGIAQLAIFGNGLPGLCTGRMICRLVCACTYGVLVGKYHILPCNKAKQQYPCADNMVFVSFQVSTPFGELNAKIGKKTFRKVSIAT